MYVQYRSLTKEGELLLKEVHIPFIVKTRNFKN